MSETGGNASTGIGLAGASFLAVLLLWWFGFMFAEWTLFVSNPRTREGVAEAVSLGQYESLGECRVAADLAEGKRSDGELNLGKPLFEGGVFFCGLACSPNDWASQRQSERSAAACRRIEPR